MNPLLEGLTPSQCEAVEHFEGPLLILAGPGSGKTRVVTHRIARLLDRGVPAHQILALTFTNKAADEMRQRVAALAPGEDVWLGTFHRFCARLLRRYASLVGLGDNYTIYDTDDARHCLRGSMAHLKIDRQYFAPDAIAEEISWAKNQLLGPEEYAPRPGVPFGAVVRRTYAQYQADLLRANAVDFDDLLLHVARLLRDSDELRRRLDRQYRFVLVDEYQDTNLAQYAIARALSVDEPNLAVTGDPDQSIYGWRGADLKNILEFEHDYPSVKVVRLEQNYRSTKRILHVAATLIAHNVKRKQKELYTEIGEGAAVRLVRYPTSKEEADDVADRIARTVRSGLRRPRDFAIFYRMNALSRPFETALQERGVPYQIVHGLAFFQRKEIKDIVAYLRLLNNPRDDQAAIRAINAPPRGIGKTTLERLTAFAAERGMGLLEAIAQCRNVPKLTARAVRPLIAFAEMIDRLSALAGRPLEEVLGHVITESGYRAQFAEVQGEESQQRVENLEDLLSYAREFDERSHERPLEEFLEQASLVNDTDDYETERDRVTLMTLHASKGLEFPAVYLVAVEEGFLPHERSKNNRDETEEERRLMFVGITRAKQELQISLAANRDFRGQRRYTVPSQFLMELPRSEMDVRGMTAESSPTGDEHAHPASFEEPVFRAEPLRQDTAMPPRGPVSTGFLLKSAAEMAGEDYSFSPDDYALGMLVLHPMHGLGTIVALSGAGDQRAATVEFKPAQRLKFVLAESMIRPVKRP